MTSREQERRAELQANLDAVEAEIAAACAAAGRTRESVTLVAVTKTWPSSDLRLLLDLGVNHFGENREQEASDKAAELAGSGAHWHFIGQLQTNKAASVARFAHVVHSIDRLKLAQALSRGVVAASRELAVLIQVSLDEEASNPAASLRGGVRPAEVGALAAEIAHLPGLRLAGVMGVAPLAGPAAPAFEVLASCSEALRAAHPGADWISAGMSGDLKEAVAAGATHLRIGSALLGKR